MPIRTNRGRAAVYRRLWGWPLRSPRHLIGTLVLLAILLTALGIVLPQAIGKPKATGAGSPPATTTAESTPPGLAAPVPATSTLPTRLTAPLATPTSAPPNDEAVHVAKAWAEAWVHHPAGITNQQWLDGLRPYTTEEFLPVMSTVDPPVPVASRRTDTYRSWLARLTSTR